MSSFAFKHKSTAHVGHNVSHAKNKTKRKFRYNLHTVTVVVDGIKQKMRVPSRVLKTLKQSGLTTHWRKPE
ncbi:MAG: hypothetical protein BroJett025_00620 [Patescibacteria group bacterium]|nr:MAG: hypothetical protein BroJett025_00620 [Patescibacteria group bacterium]